MKTMYEYAEEYARTHMSGCVTKVNDYSFEFTLYPKKEDEKVKSFVIMLSYFLKID